MSIVRTTAYTVDLDKGTTEDRWDSPLTYGDKNADKIQATLMRGSAAATVSGLSAMLYGVRSDGTTAFKAATVADNVVTVELDYPFYAIPGKIDLLLQLSEGTTVISTPLRITAYVKSGQTDELVSTGEQFSLAELQAIITECETATGSANDAAAAANSAADGADAATEAANLAAGNAQDAADAITDITAEAGTLAPGSAATAFAEEDPEDGHINLVIGVPQGIQGERGYLPWYGTAITGTSDVPTAYPTNLAMVKTQDIYIYTGIDSANAGNEYVCTLGGDEATALWVFLRNSRGMNGAGNVSFVDSMSPDGEGNVSLGAVRYGDAMALTAGQKDQACSNAGAVRTSKINNTLTSEDATEVLGAPMGKALDEAKANIVSGAVVGNFAMFAAGGQPEDSGKKAADFQAVMTAGTGYINPSEGYTAVSDASNVFACDVDSKSQKDFAFTIADATAKTIILSNVPSGIVNILLKIRVTTAAAVTWTLDSRTLSWLNGSAPDMESGYTYLVLLTWDADGTRWIAIDGTGVAN